MKKLLRGVATVAILGGLLLAAPSTTQARTPLYDLYVSKIAVRYTNDDGGTGCKVADFDNIQSALNRAWVGSTIYVCAGTYYENLEVNDPYVAIVGSGQSKTVLARQFDWDPTIDANGFPLWVKDLRMTNGQAGFGGAIYTGGADFNCTNVRFDHNFSNNDGGAIYAGGGDVHSYGCTFDNNYANNVGGAILADQVDIQNSKFTDNEANGVGGAVHANWTSSIANSVFIGNHANIFDAGAVYVNGGGLTITGGSFIGNYAPNIAGAVLVNSSGDLYATGTLFKDNRGSIFASAVFAHSAYLTKVRFSGNVDYYSGGFDDPAVYINTGPCGTYLGVRWGAGQYPSC